MNISYKWNNEIIKKKLKIKYNKRYKSREYVNEILINSREIKVANIMRKYLKEDRAKFIVQDDKDKMKIQDKKCIDNKVNPLLNKNL